MRVGHFLCISFSRRCVAVQNCQQTCAYVNQHVGCKLSYTTLVGCRHVLKTSYVTSTYHACLAAKHDKVQA